MSTKPNTPIPSGSSEVDLMKAAVANIGMDKLKFDLKYLEDSCKLGMSSMSGDHGEADHQHITMVMGGPNAPISKPSPIYTRR